MERYLTLASAWPSFSSGTGDSDGWRSPVASRPFGRDCRRSWRLVKDTLEGDVFVGDLWAGGGVASTATVGIVGGCGVGFEVVTAAGARGRATFSACRGAIGAAAEHAEIGSDNLKAGAFLASFVLPLARLDAAFNENKRTFFQILLGDFGLFAPNDDLVPLGALLALAIFVFVSFIRGDGKIRDGLAAAGVARFGIAAQAADENHFID